MSDFRWLRWGFAHEQTAHSATYYARERFKKRQRPRKVVEPILAMEPTMEQIAEPNNLINVFYQLRARAGQAAGPDHITYSLLGRREVPDILRDLSQALLTGQYRPGPGRLVPIPKPGGGTRTLTIRGICDRIVAAALNEAMSPLLESIFLPMSMGFRRGRGVWTLLAELATVMSEQGRFVLAIDDVRKAFDNIVIDDVMTDHRRYITNSTLLTLIETVLRGSEGKKVGIDQGSAFSPAALNLRLHHVHDLGFQDHDPPRLRYADNLVYLCQEVAEGNQVLSKAGQLLEKADLTLKGADGPPKDLQQGDTAELLGFVLSLQENQLCFTLGKNAWNKLGQDLIEAHTAADPATTARMVVYGWINGYGAAFESTREDVARLILQTAARNGFREIATPSELRERCLASWDRWQAYRQKASQRPPGRQDSGG